MKIKTGAPIALAGMLGLGLSLGGCAIFKHGTHKTPTVGERVSILVSETAAENDPALASTPVSLPPAEANAVWAQSGGTADKAMGHLALAATPARLWSVTINGGSERERLGAAPVIADGKLFVIDVGAVVHAFDANTGAALWQTPIAGDDKKTRPYRFGGGVSFDDGRVFATDGVGDVVALAADDGKEVWRAKPGGPLRGSPTIANGNVYALTQDNQLFALGQADGKVQWTQSGSLESQGVFGVAAPASSQGTVVAGFSSGELNAYRYENGRTLWGDALSRSSATTSVSSLADIDADPVIDQGRVFAVGQGGRMVSVDLATGARVWEQNLAGISTPWIAGEWLFVVTDDARLICLARASGKVRWIAQLQHFRHEKSRKGAITWYGPVLAGGKLVLTNSLGQVEYRSPTDGAEVSTVRGKDPFALPPVVAASTLYTLDQRGRVTAYR